MSLIEWANKSTSIVDTYGNAWDGVVIDYLFPDENETGNESIIVETRDGKLVEFEEHDIETIRIS